MKKTVKLLGLLAFVAAIVFSMTAATCGSKTAQSTSSSVSETADSKAASTSGGSESSSSGGGITVTGIPSQYNGQYATAGVHGLPLYGAQSFSNPFWILPRISNGTVTIPLWNGQEFTRWYGSATGTILVQIRTAANAQTNPTAVDRRLFSSVTITNGDATIAWSQGITP